MGLLALLKEKSGSQQSVALAELSAPATRAKSAFFSGMPGGKQARFEDMADDDSPKEPSTPTLVVRSSAKSFTAGLQRPFAAPEPSDVRGREVEREGPTPRDVQYTGINQFQQVVELYRGSISTVYRAMCGLTQSPVIIKAYQKSKMKEKNFLRMEREIRLMRALEGREAIVQLFNVFEDPGFKYLVMEMCKGGDLFKAMLLRGGKVDEKWACAEMVAPLLRTLVELHRAHILHRDIKPENIFLTSSQRFKLGDLGLAIQSDLELPFTRSGTLDYLSPEVLANPTCDLQESPKVTRAELKNRGVRPYDEKVDCWAAGVLAYELVVGRPPFEVKDEAKTASAIMYKNDFPLPSKYSAQWADFVTQALQKNPALRPSAAQLLAHPWVTMHGRAADKEAGLPEVGQPGLSLTQPNLRHSQSMGPSIAPTTPNITKESLPPSRAQEAPADPRRPGAVRVAGPDARGGNPLPPSPLGARPASRAGGTTGNESTDRSSTWSISEFSSDTDRSSAGSPVSMIPKPYSPQPVKPRIGAAASPKTGLENLQLEASGSSFTSLLAAAPTGNAGYIDSGDILDERERRAGGMRIRMKHYFKRQA